MFHNVPAANLVITIDEEELIMKARKFKSGSVGWFLGGKHMIAGRKCQLSFSAVVIGSKPPEELIDIDTEEDLRTLMDKTANLPPVSESGPEKGKKPRKGKKLS